MRIGFLLSGSLDTITGGYIYDRKLVEFLQGSGHQVEILPITVPLNVSKLFKGLRSLETGIYDVLLEDELDHRALIQINRTLKTNGECPIVSIVHNLHSLEFGVRKQDGWDMSLEREYLDTVDGFVFNSRTTRRAVENLAGSGYRGVIAPPGGDRLPGGISEAGISERACKPGPLRILFLANLLPNKGLQVLLNAIAGLPEDKFVLTVIGNQSTDLIYANKIASQIRRLGLEDKVNFSGTRDDAALAAGLLENHVMAVPSFYEGFGIAYLEGMAFGLPAIATTSGAAGEIIRDGENGFLIEPGDSASLAQRLQELDENRELLSQMGINALRRFKEQPTWADSGKDVLEYLSEIVRTYPEKAKPRQKRGHLLSS